MSKLFRTLIAVSTFLYICWYFQPYNTLSFYDEETLTLLEWSGYGVSTFLSYPPFLVFFLYCVSAIGLFFYISFARIFFVVLITFNIIIAPWAGVFVSTGLDNFFGQLVTTIDGIILYMIYFSSISSKFIK